MSQSGYIEQTITSSDTISVYKEGQIYWTLEQGFTDRIVEIRKNESGWISETKYDINDRETDGYVKEYQVESAPNLQFVIQFHTRN